MTQATDFDAIRCLDLPLSAQLAAYAKGLEGRLPVLWAAYQALVEQLVRADAGQAAPAIGQPLPAFLLPDSDGQLVALADLLREAALVVSFNRGNWCSFCRLELAALSDRYAKLRAAGAEVVSIMPERSGATATLRQKLDLPFRILSDLDNGYAAGCGLMVSLGTSVRELFLEAGLDLAAFQGNDSFFVPIPATYLIDQGGIIRARFVDVDFRRRMAPEAILTTILDLQSGQR